MEWIAPTMIFVILIFCVIIIVLTNDSKPNTVKFPKKYWDQTQF